MLIGGFRVKSKITVQKAQMRPGLGFLRPVVSLDGNAQGRLIPRLRGSQLAEVAKNGGDRTHCVSLVQTRAASAMRLQRLIQPGQSAQRIPYSDVDFREVREYLRMKFGIL